MNPRNATKNSVNGPPKWVTLTTPSVISSEQRDTILSLSPTTSFLDWVKDTNPEIIDCLKKREDGGGGWSLGCSKLGKRSAITGDLAWKLSCATARSRRSGRTTCARR